MDHLYHSCFRFQRPISTQAISFPPHHKWSETCTISLLNMTKPCFLAVCWSISLCSHSHTFPMFTSKTLLWGRWDDLWWQHFPLWKAPWRTHPGPSRDLWMGSPMGTNRGGLWSSVSAIPNGFRQISRRSHRILMDCIKKIQHIISFFVMRPLENPGTMYQPTCGCHWL